MATDPQWHPQGLDELKGVEGSKRPQLQVERRVRPHKEQALNCPRCNSANTKFCYYNNYSLSQPRYFCKTCRRYWTEGGSLRNVPVGGGSRKNKRSSSSSSSSSFSPSTSSLTSSTTITTTSTTIITTPTMMMLKPTPSTTMEAMISTFPSQTKAWFIMSLGVYQPCSC
ncbi:hypothetical protein HPP92_012578 [Vanilla planifolia]|uniref:Dof zinc finger protein n=1 Tax=Vanilla planifolia TaxID=51239 RepID=A0A835QSE1_VANPL|nr:hypothetical protein HPP92_012578 [Vanilla planifolia]